MARRAIVSVKQRHEVVYARPAAVAEQKGGTALPLGNRPLSIHAADPEMRFYVVAFAQAVQEF